MTFSKLANDFRLRVALVVIAIVLILTLVVVLGFLRAINAPVKETGEAVVLEILPGSSLSQVGQQLQRMDLLDMPLLLQILARFQGVEGAIQSGEYEINPGDSLARILDKFVRGENRQYRITLIEGWTFAETLEAIWQTENLEREISEYEPEIIAAHLQLDVASPEGMLFPDTYFYTAGASDLDLLIRASERLDEVLADAWSERLGALPFESPYEALILASIIEKESAELSERGHIAGVFVRRLERGMRLQSDPTVIYGIGADFDGDIRRTDLEAATLYNTYRINGLPPTPIALAGRASIEAALNPLESDYLYFVSRGDGSHQFSTTLAEHNAAVAEYQLGAVEQ